MDFTKFKQYPKKISCIFNRFPLSMGFAVLTAVIAIFLYHATSAYDFFEHHEKLISWIILFPTLSIFLAAATKLLQEAQGYTPKKGWIISIASEVVLCILSASIIMFSAPEADSFAPKIIVFSAIVAISPLVVPFFKNKNDLPLWNFIGKTII